MTNLTYVTSNPGKIEEFTRHCRFPFTQAALEFREIQSLDLAEIVRDKALQAYAQIKAPVLVDDCSLTFNALGKLPGPFIKWFHEELGNQGLCDFLAGKSDRSCTATVIFALYDGREMNLFSGTMEGTIAENPRGDKSFGWTPIYIPKGYTQTYAELSDEEQQKVAMQKFALEKLAKYLK